MPKLWIDNKMYSVEAEVRDYCDKLEDALREIVKESGDIEKSKWPTQQQKCFAIAQQALKGE